MTTNTLILRNSLSELGRAAGFVEQFGRDAGLSVKVVRDLELAVSEILTNIISYAYGDDLAHEVTLRLEATPEEVVVLIEDDGVAFDPSQAPAPSLDLPLEERPIGGLGIHLVREMTDSMIYRREGGKNRLWLHKRRLEVPEASTIELEGLRMSTVGKGDIVVLHLHGRLDAGTAAALQARLHGAIEEGARKLVIDGRQLVYVGSAGLQTLLSTAKQLRKLGGKILLSALPSHVRDVFDVAGVAPFFEFHSSEAEAVTALR